MEGQTLQRRATEDRSKPLVAVDLLLQRTNHVVYQVDARGVIVKVSGACNQVLGYSARDLEGRVHLSHVHSADIRVVKTAISSQWRQATPTFGPPMLLQYRRKRRDGSYMWVEMASTVGDLGGSNLMMLVIERSTEVEKQAHQTAELERQRRQKAEAAKAANEDTLGCVFAAAWRVGSRVGVVVVMLRLAATAWCVGLGAWRLGERHSHACCLRRACTWPVTRVTSCGTRCTSLARRLTSWRTTSARYLPSPPSS